MYIDLTGRYFGRLFVLNRIENKNKQTYWLCECQCENKTLKEVRGSHLKSGRIKSCGCLYKDRLRSKVPPNKFEFKENYKIGYTDKDEEFYYDINDAKLVEKHSWYFDKDGYVVARINDKGIKLHKLLLKTNKKIDHKNRYKYDNRRKNLRIANDSQNSINIDLKSNNTSGVTGVGWYSTLECWRARITVNNKEMFLGNFMIFEDAVKVRKEAEIKYFGEYAPQEHLS